MSEPSIDPEFPELEGANNEILEDYIAYKKNQQQKKEEK